MEALVQIFYKDPANGQVSEVSMYAIDARDAVRRFPDQYKLTAWEEVKPVKVEPSIRKTV